MATQDPFQQRATFDRPLQRFAVGVALPYADEHEHTVFVVAAYDEKEAAMLASTELAKVAPQTAGLTLRWKVELIPEPQQGPAVLWYPSQT